MRLPSGTAATKGVPRRGGARPLRASILCALLALGPITAPLLPAMIPQPAIASPLDLLIERLRGARGFEGVASSNGRIEAQSVDVAAKYAERLTEVAVEEGDVVEAGAPIARQDDRDARAQLLSAEAAVSRARAGLAVAEATVMQAQSQLSLARTAHARTARLNRDGHAADSVLDDAVNALQSAEAALAMARAQVQDAQAAIASSQAEVERLKLVVEDLTIRAPIRGRVLYRLREPGEVVAAGAPVVTLLELRDVYMNIYLDAASAGALAAGDEARLILDPGSDYVLPARVTFISPQAQFTPKAVETQAEREELVFRVKLALPPDLLESFERYIKSGVRGVGFVRRDPAADWPEALTLKLPE